jgi:crotonobetainyl-CoA:carnitine CoA-transferase CaiB-like acyl-CoA transferase
MLVLLQSDKFWTGLVTVSGKPEMATDSASSTRPPVPQLRQCITLLDEAFGHPLDHWQVLEDFAGAWSAFQTLDGSARTPRSWPTATCRP